MKTVNYSVTTNLSDFLPVREPGTKPNRVIINIKAIIGDYELFIDLSDEAKEALTYPQHKPIKRKYFYSLRKADEIISTGQVRYLTDLAGMAMGALTNDIAINYAVSVKLIEAIGTVVLMGRDNVVGKTEIDFLRTVLSYTPLANGFAGISAVYTTRFRLDMLGGTERLRGYRCINGKIENGELVINYINTTWTHHTCRDNDAPAIVYHDHALYTGGQIVMKSADEVLTHMKKSLGLK